MARTKRKAGANDMNDAKVPRKTVSAKEVPRKKDEIVGLDEDEFSCEFGESLLRFPISCGEPGDMMSEDEEQVEPNNLPPFRRKSKTKAKKTSKTYKKNSKTNKQPDKQPDKQP